MVRLLLFLMAIFSPVRAGEMPADLVARNWNSRNGLPQDHVRAMVQTRDGFLWLGTDSGLARFDGHSFQRYGLRERLGAVAVLSLLEADDGTLWIGTLGGGISMMRNGVILKSFPEIQEFSAAIPPVLSQDAEGAIWVGGAYRLEGGTFVCRP